MAIYTAVATRKQDEVMKEADVGIWHYSLAGWIMFLSPGDGVSPNKNQSEPPALSGQPDYERSGGTETGERRKANPTLDYVGDLPKHNHQDTNGKTNA